MSSRPNLSAFCEKLSSLMCLGGSHVLDKLVLPAPCLHRANDKPTKSSRLYTREAHLELCQLVS